MTRNLKTEKYTTHWMYRCNSLILFLIMPFILLIGVIEEVKNGQGTDNREDRGNYT